MTRRTWRLESAVPVAVALSFSLWLVPLTALAGGFYFGDRGTRPMGRGGAFVAGADDPGSLWYNPAGLGWSGQQLLFDATLTLFEGSFTRIDGGGNTLTTVDASVPPLPVPTLAYSDDLGVDDFTFGAGVFAPNALLLEYPETVEGMPAPQRYSLISMDGSLLVDIAVGAAWRPTPELSIGLDLQLIVGSFRTVTMLSACDRFICSQPENPEYDSLSELALDGVVAPTAALGAIYDLGVVRLGASLQLPYSISGDATIRVRLPSAAEFDSASVDGDEASVDVDFPFIARAGAEVRPAAGLRIEGAIVFEGWSIQDALRIEPHDVWMRNVAAVGDYQVGPMAIPRNMNDVWSIRAGGEYAPAIAPRRPLTLRAGALYETSGFDDAYLTPLTLDSDKLVVSLGASYEVARGFFVDALLAHAFVRNREVRDSAVPQTNPIRPEPLDPVFVGNGDYAMEANLVGLGLRWQIEPGRAPAAAPESDETEPAPTTTVAPAEAPAPAPAEQAPAEPAAGPGEQNVPWYLRGQSQQQQPAASPSADGDGAEPADEPAPRRRRRRRHR